MVATLAELTVDVTVFTLTRAALTGVRPVLDPVLTTAMWLFVQPTCPELNADSDRAEMAKFYWNYKWLHVLEDVICRYTCKIMCVGVVAGWKTRAKRKKNRNCYCPEYFFLASVHVQNPRQQIHVSFCVGEYTLCKRDTPHSFIKCTSLSTTHFHKNKYFATRRRT